MAESSDNAREIFQPSKGTKSEVRSYFGYYKSAEENLNRRWSPCLQHMERGKNEKVAAKGGITSNLESSS